MRYENTDSYMEEVTRCQLIIKPKRLDFIRLVCTFARRSFANATDGTRWIDVLVPNFTIQ
jgi:hypothetical protein